MLNIVSKITSYIFHPLLITTLIFTLLFYQFPDISYRISYQIKWKLITAIFIITFLIPTISSFLLLKSGYIESMQMANRKERNWPFLFTIVIYLIDCYFFNRAFKQDTLFTLIMVTITANMIFLALINLKWKISIHAAGVGGLLAFYIVCSILNAFHFDMQLMISIIMIAGLVISSRLQLNSHTMAQVIAGFCVGLFTGLSSLLFLI